jgi:hypothetical protein
MILKGFEDHTINLTRRCNNRVADALANHARTTGACTQGDEICPIIGELVMKDLSMHL